MLAKALLSASVSAPPAVYVEDVFSTFLYTGNGGTQTITNGIDLSGKGGLVWLKRRNDISEHGLYDTARGAAKLLQSQSAAAQISSYSGVSAFGATGFDLGTELNANGGTYASWTFRKAAKFFDVVTYTGNGTSQDIAHSLGSVPGCMIVKQTNGTNLWTIYHRGVDASNPQNYGLWFQTNARDLDTYWNNTAPTATQFTVGPKDGTNASGATYVAYLFAHDAGGFGDAGTDNVSACGTYTGNGSATGPTVTLNWEPQWLLVKRTNSTGDWQLIDNMRGFVVGGADAELNPNLSSAESTGTFVSPLSTGFQLNTTDAGYNATGGTYIYIAIRRGPMKTPTVGTQVLRLNARTGTGANLTTTGIGFPHDAVVIANRSAAGDWKGWFDRLRGNNNYLLSDVTNAEASGSGYGFNDATGTAFLTTNNRWNRLSATHIDYFFRRAPGFFDVVAYTGDGNSLQTVNHGLGVKPQFYIIKCRSNATTDWFVWAQTSTSPSPNGTWTLIKLASGAATYSGVAGIGTTSTYFETYWDGGENSASGRTYIAYLFATAPGVSKVGSYTGTGTTKQIDCGFTAGARFVLIKRTDSTGDWYTYDTARGIISGNDPYLLLNSTAAEVTSTDYIDPLSSGFEISSTAPAAINANGGSFIFLAIA